jgi:hypothetical protein
MQDSNALPISDPWFCYALHLTRAESCDESEICLPDAGVWGARKTFSLIIAFEVCTVSDAHHASRRWSIGEISPLQCAGINRHEVEDERALRERSSDPLGLESCAATVRDTAKRR